MVAESNNAHISDQDGRRSRIVPSTVGTPTTRGTGVNSSARRATENIFGGLDSKFEEESNRPKTILETHQEQKITRSQPRFSEVKDGRRVGRPGEFSSVSSVTPSIQLTPKQLHRVFREESSSITSNKVTPSSIPSHAKSKKIADFADKYAVLADEATLQMSQMKVQSNQNHNEVSMGGVHNNTHSSVEEDEVPDEKYEDEIRVKEAMWGSKFHYMEKMLAEAQENMKKMVEAHEEQKRAWQEEKEKSEKEKEEKKKKKAELKELAEYQKSKCDFTRIKALADGYIKQNGRMKDTEHYERKFIPYIECYADQEDLQECLLDLDGPKWTDDCETKLESKKRKEFYHFLTSIIDADTMAEKMESTVRQSAKNDAQAYYRRLSKLLRRGETEGEGNVCLQELLNCTMTSTGKTISGFGIEIVRYQNLLKDLKMEQSEKHMLIPHFLKGLSPACKEIKILVEGRWEKEEIKTLEEVIKACEVQAKQKGLQNTVVKKQNSLQVKGDGGKAAKAPKQNKSKKESADRSVKVQTEELKKQLIAAVMEAEKVKQNYSKNVGPKDCRYGVKADCPRPDCKFVHKPPGKKEGQSTSKEVWCDKCQKKTNHTSEQHGKCWSCGDEGHRSFQCPSKKTVRAKDGKTTLYAGSQAVQSVEVDGKVWVAFQGNLRVQVPTTVANEDAYSSSDLEKPVHLLPRPALGRMKEILTHCSSSKRASDDPFRAKIRLPQQVLKDHRKKGKKRRAKQKRTPKVSASEKKKFAKTVKEKRGKVAKKRNLKMKQSSIRRKKLRMRGKRDPVTRWTFKSYFKLGWHIESSPRSSLNQKRRARKKERQRRQRRVLVVKITQEEYKKRDAYLRFKRELVQEIAKRKTVKSKVFKAKVLEQFKALLLVKGTSLVKDGKEVTVLSSDDHQMMVQMVQTVHYVQSLQKKEQTVSTILDSGAMANSGDSKRSKMVNLTPLSGPVAVLGCTGVSTPVTHSGEWELPTLHPKFDLTLKNVLDIPGTHQNLISVGCLDDSGMKIVFENQEGRVYAPDGGLLLLFKKEDGLYVLSDEVGKEIKVNPQHVVQWEVSNLLSAHETLNHMGFDRLRALLNFPPASMTSPNPVCKACLNAQLVHGKQNKEGQRAAPRYGYRLHSDTSRKIPASNVFGQNGIQRFQLTGDEFTGSLWIDFLHRKSDAKTAVIARIDKLNNELGSEPVIEHQTDGGKEYLNKWLDAQLKKRNVEPRNSTPYQQHENGWIEVRMRLLQNGASAMMWRGKAPPQDYPYALRHWLYLHDILPSAVTGMSPYEKRVGIPSGVRPNHIRGKLFCACYAKLYVHGKLQRDVVKCIYLGKDPRSNGVLVRPIGGKVSGVLVRSAQAVKFLPDEFPYANPQVPRPEPVAGYNFDSDSDQGEDEINLKSDDDDVNSDDDSEEEQSDDELSEDETEDEAEDATEDDAEELQEESKQSEAKIQEAKKQSLMEPNDVQDAPDGDIDGESAWEIKEIVDERVRKIGKKRYTQYKVVWAGEFPDQWLVKSRVRAPAAVKAWNEKKKSIKQSLMLVTRRYCQLNMCVDPVTPEVLKHEGNPFKSLFDPKKERRPENPVGYKKMMQHQFADYFVQALIKEKLENLKWRAYEEVRREDVPKGTKILRPMTAYQIKYNASGEIEKFKSRVCLDGSRTIVDDDETYEAIADFGTIRMLLCIATRYDMEIVQTDVKNFFLQARLPPDKQYYCEIPDGWAENDPKTHVAKVLAPWYGLKESAKLAGDQLAKVLEEAGMKENPYMPKVFWKWDGDDLIICANHIDDACWISTSMDKLNKTLDMIEKKFKLDRTYNPTKLLGVEIEYDRKRGMMKLHQGSYNRAKAQEMGLQGKKLARSPGHIPAKIVNPLFPGGNQVKASAEEIRNYQKKIGVQMWALQTDPSSMFTVYQLAKHMLNPQKEHWEAMSRLERYKFNNPEIGIVFRRAASKERLKKGQNLDCLTFFADADLAGDQQDAKSTSGWCVHLGESGMFDWKSKKQTCVCQSSCEAEIYANKECTNYAVWIRPALTLMGFSFTRATPIAQDNSSAIATCTGSKHHSRQRHFRMQINLLRDCCDRRITAYPWVPTKEMKGDLFNKMHSPSEHERLCELNGIYAEGLKFISEEPKMLKLSGWTDKIDPTKKTNSAKEV